MFDNLTLSISKGEEAIIKINNSLKTHNECFNQTCPKLHKWSREACACEFSDISWILFAVFVGVNVVVMLICLCLILFTTSTGNRLKAATANRFRRAWNKKFAGQGSAKKVSPFGGPDVPDKEFKNPSIYYTFKKKEFTGIVEVSRSQQLGLSKYPYNSSSLVDVDS